MKFHRIIKRLFFLVLLLNAFASPSQSFEIPFLTRPKVTVNVNSNPQSAEVYFSAHESSTGVLIGSTPYSSPQEYDFEKDLSKFEGYYIFKKAGYKTEKKQLKAPPEAPRNKMLELFAELTPITTIQLNVTSNPTGATIYFQESNGGSYKKLGVANPKFNLKIDDSESDLPPSWSKGVYKAELNGYRIKRVEVEKTGGNREVIFNLDPLPPVPADPVPVYPEQKMTFGKPVVDSFPPVDIGKTDPVAVQTFISKNNHPAAVTATEKLIYKLQRKGYFIHERETIEKATAAASAAVQNSALADIDLAKELAASLNCKYVLTAVVGELGDSVETLSVKPVLSDAEKERYQKEYEEYVGYYKGENIAPPKPVKTLEELTKEIISNVKSSKVNVSKMAISVKLIEAANGRTVWKGTISATEKDINSAVENVTTALADSIVAAK